MPSKISTFLQTNYRQTNHRQTNHRQTNHRPHRDARRRLNLLLSFLLLFGNIVQADKLSPSHHIVTDTQNQSQPQSEVRPLEFGKSDERELPAGEIHSYRLKLEAGQFVGLEVEQRRADVFIRLWEPEGQKFTEFDSRWHGPEPVSIIARAPGFYRLEIRAREINDLTGKYVIRASEPRAVEPRDESRIASERLATEAKQLFLQATAAGLIAANKKYEEALSLWRSLGDQRGEAQTLNSLGVIQLSLGLSAKARGSLNQALDLRLELADRSGQAETLGNLGVLTSLLGEKTAALDYYARALAVWRELGDRRWQGNILSSMSAVYSGLGQYRKALECSNEALPLHQSIGDQRGEALALSNLGVVHNLLGDHEKALASFERARDLASMYKDRLGEAHACNYLGKVHTERGERQKGMAYFQRALETFRQLSNKGGEAIALTSLGAACAMVGEKEEAVVHLEKTLPLFQLTGNRAAEAAARINLGFLHNDLGDPDKALDFYQRARVLAQNGKDSRTEATALDHIGVIHLRRHEYQTAAEYFALALPLSRATSDRRNEAGILINLAYLAEVSGRTREASANYRQSLALSQASGDREIEINTRYGLAGLAISQNQLAEARVEIETAIGMIESMRHELVSQELRTSYRAMVQHFYERGVAILMQLHRQQPAAAYNQAALKLSEQARARGLLELLAEAQTDIRQGVSQELLQQERNVRHSISIKADRQIRSVTGKEKPEADALLADELKTLRHEYREVAAKIRAASPRYAALTQPQPLEPAGIQQQLDAGTLLLEYALGEEHSYLWAVTPGGITSYELPKRAEIETAAKRLFDSLSVPRGRKNNEDDAPLRRRVAKLDAESQAAAAELSRMVIAPAAAVLGKKRLAIVADGGLQYIPFAVLPKPRITAPRRANGNAVTPLIAEHEIVSLPSASTLAVLRRELKERTPAPMVFAALADPVFEQTDKRGDELKLKARKNASPSSAAKPATPKDAMQKLRGAISLIRMRGSREEAQAIASLAPAGSKVWLDFDAGYAAATSAEMAGYRYLHFATHGLFNAERPELSGIVLSLFDEQGHEQNGLLRLDDVYNLRLAAEMVTLSACQSALGKDVKGEGLIGLTRGFMYAGAARVTASLWQVEEEGTKELMIRFYRGMLGAKHLRPAEALRAAQLSMLRNRDPQWRSPYYWGAFILQGEWR